MQERLMIAFNVPSGPIGPSDVGDSLDRLRRLPGVHSVVLYQTRDNRVPYLLDVQVESTDAERLQRELSRLTAENADNLSNVVQRRYTKLA